MVNKRTASKEEIRIYDREWYANNKDYRERQIKLKSERRRRNAKFLWDYKTSRGCQLCGEKDPACLDFHHEVGNKEAAISNVKTWGRERLKEEIKKCMVLCANCHRRLHYYGSDNNM